MQIERPKIELYEMRSIGEKFSAVFGFIRENFKLLLRACTYLLLPLCLVQGVVTEVMMNVLMPFYTNTLGIGNNMDLSDSMLLRMGGAYLGYFLCMMVGDILLTGICFGMVKYYQASPNRLRGVMMSDLKPTIIKVIKRSLVMSLVLVAILIVLMALLITFTVLLDTVILLVFFILGILVLSLPVSMAIPVYVFEEDESLFNALLRGIRLGFKSFWSLLGLIFVMGFLSNTISSFTTLPWYMLTIVRGVFMVDQPSQAAFIGSPVYSFCVYLASVFMNFCMYLTETLSTFALAFHYGSIAEEEDGFSVEKDIQRFEELKEEDNDIDNFDKL